MNADERGLKNKQLHSSIPRSSVFIRGQEAFFSNLLGDGCKDFLHFCADFC